jgi:hypothetical protein
MHRLDLRKFVTGRHAQLVPGVDPTSVRVPK